MGKTPPGLGWPRVRGIDESTADLPSILAEDDIDRVADSLVLERVCGSSTYTFFLESAGRMVLPLFNTSFDVLLWGLHSGTRFRGEARGLGALVARGMDDLCDFQASCNIPSRCTSMQ